jgi:hypothetical protein
MLISIVFGIVVLAVVIGVWVYRGTKNGEKVEENAVTAPDYDPGRVVKTSADTSNVNKTKTAATTRSNVADDGKTRLHTDPPVLPGDSDTAKTTTDNTGINTNTGKGNSGFNTGKNESFEGSGVYTGNKEKTTLNTDLNSDTDQNAYREDDLQKEKTVNTGTDENRKPKEPHMP